MSWDQSNWFQDSDGDGVDDSSDAFPYNSSETVDSDGDRMGDNYEILYSFDIGSNTDALLDFDGDGYCNLREFISGTNPKDDTDIPSILVDYDDDSDADAMELSVMYHEYGRDDCTSAQPCSNDFDGNGSIDQVDLKLFSEDFGKMQ